MLEVLAPHISEEDGRFIRVRVGDEQADIYLEAGMMVSHVEGRDPWDLLVQGTRAANWVIITVGCPVGLTQQGQREELPEALAGDVVIIETGEDLRAVLNHADRGN